jgi:hypothetical protein
MIVPAQPGTRAAYLHDPTLGQADIEVERELVVIAWLVRYDGNIERPVVLGNRREFLDGIEDWLLVYLDDGRLWRPASNWFFDDLKSAMQCFEAYHRELAVKELRAECKEIEEWTGVEPIKALVSEFGVERLDGLTRAQINEFYPRLRRLKEKHINKQPSAE